MSTQTAIAADDDLEALFDSIIAANNDENHPAQVSSESVGEAPKVMTQIGHMARALHDTLRELGLNKEIEKAASSIPDARDRLNYVATLTQQAAEKVLNATEAAQPIVERLGGEGAHLANQWDALFERKLNVEQFKELVLQTHGYLREMPKQSQIINGYLLEIMMAQDFQDLTGQVIKKIIELTRNMETQLVNLLLENAPPSIKAEFETGLLNGPVINSAGRNDVVTNQDQVDDLLESLGF